MPMPDFEEKQFEFACNIELAFQNRAVFPIGQVLESICGYDTAALQPNASPIWQILNVAPPQGAHLNQFNWLHGNGTPVTVPASQINIILQYKRSEFIDATTPHLWNLWNSDYYRFDVRLAAPNRFRQFNNLLHLQNTLGTTALVYYAAPVFHQYATLLNHQLNAQVLAHSNFVEPSSITGHAHWTFDQTGTVGQPNPAGDRHPCPTYKQVVRKAREQSVHRTLFAHLRNTAKRLGIKPLTEVPPPNWFSPVIELVKGKKRIQAFYDTLAIANRVQRADATWFLMQFAKR